MFPFSFKIAPNKGIKFKGSTFNYCPTYRNFDSVSRRLTSKTNKLNSWNNKIAKVLIKSFIQYKVTLQCQYSH